MSELFISYHPGAMGNFVKMIISSGLNGYSLARNHLLFDGETVSLIDDSGEIIPFKGKSKFDLFLDNIFFDKFSAKWYKDPTEVLPTLCRLYNKQHTLDNEFITGGHLHTSMHTNNRLDNAFHFMEKVSILNRIFITFDTKEEYDICKAYRNKKRPESVEKFTLYQHTEIHKSLLDNAKCHDIILPLEKIFDKEFMRNFLLINISNWKDLYFDLIYDNYMKLQVYRL